MGDLSVSQNDSALSPLARWGEFLRLTDDDHTQVQSVLDPIQHYARHHVVRREGNEPTHIFLLVDGWAASSMALACGRQQIVKLHLPGDLLGVPAVAKLLL